MEQQRDFGQGSLAAYFQVYEGLDVRVAGGSVRQETGLFRWFRWNSDCCVQSDAVAPLQGGRYDDRMKVLVRIPGVGRRAEAWIN